MKRYLTKMYTEIKILLEYVFIAPVEDIKSALKFLKKIFWHPRLLFMSMALLSLLTIYTQSWKAMMYSTLAFFFSYLWVVKKSKTDKEFYKKRYY